jgi:hypothetical protein
MPYKQARIVLELGQLDLHEILEDSLHPVGNGQWANGKE